MSYQLSNTRNMHQLPVCTLDISDKGKLFVKSSFYKIQPFQAYSQVWSCIPRGLPACLKDEGCQDALTNRNAIM